MKKEEQKEEKEKEEEKEEEIQEKEEECSGKVVRSAICIWEIRVCPRLPRFYSFPTPRQGPRHSFGAPASCLHLPNPSPFLGDYLGHEAGIAEFVEEQP